MSAAAFTKGLLDLEGQLTPILVRHVAAGCVALQRRDASRLLLLKGLWVCCFSGRWSAEGHEITG